ncbi:MAG TPA: AAA family ATPase, partial [Polyangiales bacterium]|nr:AAA family ATPase [Polyangiales bacterium]
ARAELGEAAWRRAVPANARALGKLVPELIADGDSHAARFQLFDEFTRFLESASRDAPRLIVLDDLHWADAATLELLAYAARTLQRRPLLLAAALRERDAALTPAHATALARIQRSGIRIALEGLSADEVAELVATLRDAPAPDRQLVAALHERTAGNPFFIQQIVALFGESQPLTAASLEGQRLPLVVSQVLAQRLAGLEESGREVLATAAVIGQVFDVRLLAELLGRSLRETLLELERARQAGVVERASSAPHEFAFSHALLREVLYDELDWTRCGALHSALARCLAARPLRDARHLGEVARHYLLAVPTELEPAVQYCRRAAAAAREASGYEVAAQLVTRALDKLASEGHDAEAYGELLLELGFDQLCSGDRQSAWQTLERGAELASQRADARQLTGFACRMADWLDAGGDEATALRQLERALALVSPSELDLRALLLARRAKLDPQLESERRIALLDEAEALAAESGEPSVAIDVAFSRAHLRDAVRPEFNLEAAARYRARVHEHPAANAGLVRQMRAATADVTECSAALALGDFAAADRALARWVSLAESYQFGLLREVARLATIGRALAEGRFDAVEAALQPRADAVGAPEQAFLWYFVLLAEARDQLALLATLELPAPAASAQLTPRQRLILPIMLAWLYVRTGRGPAARAQLASLPERELRRLPSVQGDVGALCMLAEVYCELEEHAAAKRVYAQLAPHARLNAVGPVLDSRGCVAHYLGLLAELAGDLEAARGHYRSAESAHTAWGMPVMQVRSRSRLEALVG